MREQFDGDDTEIIIIITKLDTINMGDGAPDDGITHTTSNNLG